MIRSSPARRDLEFLEMASFGCRAGFPSFSHDGEEGVIVSGHMRKQLPVEPAAAEFDRLRAQVAEEVAHGTGDVLSLPSLLRPAAGNIAWLR